MTSSTSSRKSDKVKAQIRDVIMAETVTEKGDDRIASPYYKAKENYRDSLQQQIDAIDSLQ